MFGKIVQWLSSPPKKPTDKAEENLIRSAFAEPPKYSKIGAQLGESQFPTLDSGDVTIDIYGTMASRSLMRKIYEIHHNERIMLTLTPPCKYQIEQGWPEPPFVNVNLFNSKFTERTNWIGHIEIRNPDDMDFEQLLKKRGNVNVWASIHRNGEYFTRLHLSSKYKPNEKNMVTTYASHDTEQIKTLTKLSCESGWDFVRVNMKKMPDQKHYIFLYDNTPVGTATTKKIDSCIGDKKVCKIFIRIAKFRFDDESDNKHYSQLVILTK